MCDFLVTSKAARPAGKPDECFYCQQKIGSAHKGDCVLIRKRVTVRMTVEYDIEVPAAWGKDEIEFQRNESSWCATNAIKELSNQFDTDEAECMCPVSHFTYIGNDTDSYLSE